MNKVSNDKLIKSPNRSEENGGDKTSNGREFHKMDAAQLSRALDQLAPSTPSTPESNDQAKEKRKGNISKRNVTMTSNKT